MQHIIKNVSSTRAAIAPAKTIIPTPLIIFNRRGINPFLCQLGGQQIRLGVDVFTVRFFHFCSKFGYIPHKASNFCKNTAIFVSCEC